MTKYSKKNNKRYEQMAILLKMKQELDSAIMPNLNDKDKHYMFKCFLFHNISDFILNLRDLIEDEIME